MSAPAKRNNMVPKISSGLGAQAKTPDTVQLKQSATSILKAIRPVSASVPSFSGQKESAKMPTSNDNMSNDIGAITQQQEYSYPPLGELGMNDAVQPYGNLQEERDFPHIDDERNPFENDQQQPQQEQQESMEAGTRYEQVPSPPGGTAYHNERALAFQAQTAQLVNELTNALQGIHRTGSDGESRSKPVPKPDRPVTKDTDGRFVCNWQGCDEPVKHFNRKCEWSKHMDKHDRPYKCPATGCEKLPGFTYSGGLLRHEREVHNKHGGPRRQLNCPHQNCKRHIGKGFSRQENLNEHLRRVHTDSPAPPQPATMNGGDAETEPELSEVPGAKRKRRSIGTSGPSQEDDEVREELKQLKIENESLRNSLNDLNLQFRVLQQAYIGAVQMQNPHQQQQHHQMQQVQIPQPGSAQPQPQPMATPQMQHAQMQQQPLQQQMHSPVAKFDPIPAQQNQQQAQQVLQQQQQQAQQAAAQGMQRMPAAPMM